MENYKGDAAAIADRVEKLALVENIELGVEGDKVVAVPHGKNLQSLKPFMDEWLERPRRRQGVANHKTLASLVEHTNLFKSQHSVLFADPGDGTAVDPVMLAVLNYNPSSGDEPTDWGDHRNRYVFKLSDQWKLWKSLDGKKQNVAQFSRFIEAQIEDIADPGQAGAIAKQIPDRLGFKLATPAEILALSKGLSVVVKSDVTNVIDPNTGERKLQFSQEHKDTAGKPMEVPKAFLLLIPVFQSGTVYPVGVRLTYEVEDGTVFFTTHLYREDLFFKDAFELACQEAKNATQLPLFFGSPEGK